MHGAFSYLSFPIYKTRLFFYKFGFVLLQCIVVARSVLRLIESSLRRHRNCHHQVSTEHLQCIKFAKSGLVSLIYVLPIEHILSFLFLSNIFIYKWLASKLRNVQTKHDRLVQCVDAYKKKETALAKKKHNVTRKSFQGEDSCLLIQQNSSTASATCSSETCQWKDAALDTGQSCVAKGHDRKGQADATTRHDSDR